MRSLLNKLGPGLLYAGAAIGVSHLVQSTRAGANYGFYLAGIIILANILKYPFFEISPIYTSKTKNNLLKGYKSLHPIVLIVFLLINISTFLIVLSAITLVTAGLSSLLIPFDIPLIVWVIFLSTLAVIIIHFGHYSLLKSLTKYIVLGLSILTLSALVIALINAPDLSIYMNNSFDWESLSDIAFLIALIGWMPAPMEISAWHSTWSLAEGKPPEYSTAILDFKVGYWGTMVLAVTFMTLGALVMYGSGSTFPSNPIQFAGQLIDLFTQQFGLWSFPIIALAAFGTMFTTLLTCFDAYPRVISNGVQILRNQTTSTTQKSISTIVLLASGIGVIVILYFWLDNLKTLIDFATSVGFLAANLIAIFNFLIALQLRKKGLYPKGWIRWILMIAGLLSLMGFSIVYLII